MRDSNSLRCLLDDDADTVRQARTRRLRSLAASVSFQALFITVVVVAPLLATGKLQNHWETPTPIYYGLQGEYKPPRTTGTPAKQTKRQYTPSAFVAPTVVPTDLPKPGADGPADGPSSTDIGLPVCPNCRPEIGLPPLLEKPNVRITPPTPEVRPPTPPRAARISEPVQEAKLINRVQPTYPVLCKQMRLEGSLVLRAMIGRDGEMRELTYVSGNPCFLQNSMDAISQWRYRPTILNGEAVEVETTITVVFKLNR